MLCCVADPYVGGRDFDYAVANCLRSKYRLSERPGFIGNDRSWLRLLQEVEKVKRRFSEDDCTEQFIRVGIVDNVMLTVRMKR